MYGLIQTPPPPPPTRPPPEIGRYLWDDAGIEAALDELQLGTQHLLILHALQVPGGRAAGSLTQPHRLWLLLVAAGAIQGAASPAWGPRAHLALPLPLGKQGPLVDQPLQARMAAAGCHASTVPSHLHLKLSSSQYLTTEARQRWIRQMQDLLARSIPS